MVCPKDLGGRDLPPHEEAARAEVTRGDMASPDPPLGFSFGGTCTLEKLGSPRGWSQKAMLAEF